MAGIIKSCGWLRSGTFVVEVLANENSCWMPTYHNAAASAYDDGQGKGVEVMFGTWN
jgi:hypothetical protein